MIGSRFAHYEITSHLGSGGMGEVYQATDSKLGRSVAIKVLPELFARDAERVARMEREARTLALLNHPHIAAIYGLEESGERKFLVMELAEGEMLSERIARGPLPQADAFAITRQIAEALEAAHEKGIVHRDLKPANIKVTSNGHVKVLDFGLAKAMVEEPGNQNLSHSPTLGFSATGAGMILGTAAYMSPEQAQGKETDRRTDIFALGCVLFEMLTGRQAFHGDSVAQILARVIERDPDWNLLPASTPAAIRRVLQRCLQKDRNRRLKGADAIRIEIEEVLTKPESIEAVAAPAARRRLPWIAAAVLLALIAALSIPAVRHFREAAPAEALELRTDIVTPSTTDPTSFALSPDGRQIVFVASGNGQQRLWLRQLNKTTAQPLAGTEGATYPFWSPDSQSVGFFDSTRIKRVDISGGTARVLGDIAANRGGTWNKDGVILYSRSTGSPLFRVGAAGGTPVAATKLEKQTSHRFPYFLPDGHHFLFYALGPPETSGIHLGSLDSPNIKRVTESESAGIYFMGWLLFTRGGSLLAQKLDVDKAELIADPVVVADAVSFDSLSFGAAISASANGVLAYRGGGATRRQLTWFDRSGKPLGTWGQPDTSLLAPDISPDGSRVLVWRQIQGNADLWLLDATRMTRLTFDPSLDRYGLWGTGDRIFFDSARKATQGRRNIYELQAGSPGSEKLFFESDLDKVMNDVSADGNYALFNVTDPQTGWDLWATPTNGPANPFVFLKTNFDERRAQFSPDGKWVTYTSNESGQPEAYVRPFRGEGQWQVSTGGGAFGRWSHDGKELYYFGPDGSLMAVPITVKGTLLEPGTPIALFRSRIVGNGTDVNLGINFDVSRDGRFLINALLDDVGASPITLLQNWKHQ